MLWRNGIPAWKHCMGRVQQAGGVLPDVHAVMS
jgi:hypothetical protein